MEEEKKLKPVTFISGKYGYHYQNTTQQIMLLKALSITQDPKKLRELIGVSTVADVFRTLDKMAMRKEYHAALAKKGISFDYIVDGLKSVVDNGLKNSDKIKALQILLKSIGMDKYEQEGIVGGNWEDALLKVEEKEKKEEGPRQLGFVEYDVVTPEMPDSLKKLKKKERDIGKSLYE